MYWQATKRSPYASICIHCLITWFFKVLQRIPCYNGIVQEYGSMYEVSFPFKIKKSETIAIIAKVQACLQTLQYPCVCMTSGMNARNVKGAREETEGLCNILSPEKETHHTQLRANGGIINMHTQTMWKQVILKSGHSTDLVVGQNQRGSCGIRLSLNDLTVCTCNRVQ